jgi:protein-S-isoprenylcysteine O-methyltransferase Ste14
MEGSEECAERAMFNPDPAQLLVVVWLGWAVSWTLAALWTGRTERRLVTWDGLASHFFIVAGGVMLSNWAAQKTGAGRLWHSHKASGYMLALLTLAGILFAWWARVHLGRMWSGGVALKRGQRIVESGPYALVRHPIYAGLLAATLATAIAQATATALAGWVLLMCGAWIKARIEERFLAAQLAPGAYAAYRRRVPMMLPILATGAASRVRRRMRSIHCRSERP